MLRTSLPNHGRLQCDACFDSKTDWNKSELRTGDGWHLLNNPMSWGSSTPEILMLGVSKGTRQSTDLETKSHNEIPFAGFRPQLTKALRLLGLLQAHECVDDKISSGEERWGFGSMVRCSLGLLDAGGKVRRSGSVIEELALMNESESWLHRCAKTFLSDLPNTLRLCILLSNSENYIQACLETISRLRPNTRKINDVAYGDGGTTWVHIVHVGGPGKNHINSWMEGTGRQGEKRRQAQQAVAQALANRP